jgi:hypothetical protein
MEDNYYFSTSMKRFSALLLCLCFIGSCAAQDVDTVGVNKKRLRTFVIASGVGYGATLAGLHQLWYKDSPSQAFRFFNDNAEWKQVDKLGHFYSAYYFSYGTSAALRWCNLPPKKADILGAVTGFLVLLPIEILDGHSQAYGASAGDLTANALGSSFFLGQQLLWHEQRLRPKFSFHHTPYSGMRPNVLGDNGLSEIFKDYNGQTYWISADMDKFIRFPKWLDVSVGYGAHGMFYARDSENADIGLESYRQFYLSVDLDLQAIPTKSKVLRALLFVAGTIKFPAPAIEFSRGKAAFHPLYF